MSGLRLPEKFEGPRLKIKRAQRHLKEIERLTGLYHALDPYGITYQLDADKTFYEGRLIAKFAPFLDFGIEIGEFVYQLRSALDHIVYEFSVPNFPEAVPDQRRAERVPQFPIFYETDPTAGGTKPFSDWHLKYVAEGVRELVAIYQPYGNRDAPQPHPLAVLEALSIRDKHRVVHPVATDIHVRTVDLLPKGVRWQMTSQANHREVIVYVPAHIDPVRDLDPVISYSLALRVPEVATVRLSYLGDIYQFVANEVIPAFSNLVT